MDQDLLNGLNKILALESLALRHYLMLHAQAEVWGYVRLAEKFKEEIQEELHHIEDITEHILSWDGVPDYNTALPCAIYTTVPDLMHASLDLENNVIDTIKATRKRALDMGDQVTWELLSEILMDEDESTDWLAAQINIIAKVGEANYISQQIHPAAAAT